MPGVVCVPREISIGPSFARDIKTLSGTHHLVHELMVAVLIEEIGPNPACGMGMVGFGGRVRKFRIADKCHNLGKSNGFRLIYDWDSASRMLWLLRLYTHAQIKDNVADKEIRRVLNEAGVR